MIDEGFEVPVHRSLTEEILLGGIPRVVAVLLWTGVTALGFGMREIWVLPIGVVLHVVLVYVTKQDTQFFDVFVRAVKAPKRLQP